MTIPARGVADIARAGQPDPCRRAVSYRRILSTNRAGVHLDAVLRIHWPPISKAFSGRPKLPVAPKCGRVELGGQAA
jgi:hypothetical protein